jgi:hypothetical protein
MRVVDDELVRGECILRWGVVSVVKAASPHRMHDGDRHMRSAE